MWKITSTTVAASFSTSQKLKVLLCPGQGSQHVGMCKQTLEDPIHRDWSNQLVDSLSNALNKDLRSLMLNGPQSELELTANAQPAIFTNAYVSYQKYLRESQQSSPIDTTPPFTHAIGNSVGEYTALVAAGSISPESAVCLLEKRGELMQEACEGKQCGMLAVLTSDVELVQSIIDQVNSELSDAQNSSSSSSCCIAVFASNKQLVLSGEQPPLKRVQEILKKSKRIVGVFLPVSAAFHCSLLTQIKPKFEAILRRTEILPPKLQIIRNIDMKIYTSKEDIIEGLITQIDSPVLFRQSIESLLSKVEGQAQTEQPNEMKKQLEFVEVGTTGLLTKLARDITIASQKLNSVDFVNVY